ncbi:PREDICTED: probable LRR receptor [Prunus dulcis]|uniref:non-specific serine/threonine protein kinase n=1 Tax=Prunus dulcis TaxID=3755 RepID=A0A5E4EP04_PRUDU|nr:PREDICTED: probable LRR receptor [Prunus dulcis]
MLQGSGFQQLNRRTTIEIPHDKRFLLAAIHKLHKSLGRRVFDIYIPGNLRRKDFDISKEVGGVNRAVPRPFKVNVTENYLDIHLSYTNYSRKEEQDGLIVGIAVSVGVVILLLLFAVLYMRRKTSEKDDDEDLLGLGPRPNTFSYAELRAATEDFNPSNKLGEGGYGPVYKGTLSDGRVVAVKQLSVASHQGKSQFVTEIATISTVQHRNLVKLYGCCIEGSHRILVYEYLENKSLDQALFGRNDLHLDWPTRFNILLGTARGLAYLHEESKPRIVHRDVKASNILLDAELSPKISDFGWAKLYDDKKTHMSTRVAGTIGYLAPEYAMRGHLTEKADVFVKPSRCNRATKNYASDRQNEDDEGRLRLDVELEKLRESKALLAKEKATPKKDTLP